MSGKGKNSTKKMTAAQRIEHLEGTIMGIYKNFDILANDIDQLRNTITGLAKRLNATIEAAESGTVNNEQVNNIIIQQNVEELKAKVEFLVEQGVLKKSEENVVGENSFVVGRELDGEKNVLNPRLQFAFATLNETGKELVKGKTLGDLVKNENNDGHLEITEIFDVVDKLEKDVSVEDDEESAKDSEES